MKTYQLTVPKPCNVSWDAMTPNAQGRFCGSCQKSVTDFTGMTDFEISNYMLLNVGKNVCGRFKTKQLDRIIIQIPETVLYTQTSFRKIFMLALLFAMGTTLFSCTDAEGNKQPVEKVVITNTITSKEEIIDISETPHEDMSVMMGDVVYVPDSLRPPVLPAPEKEK